MVIVFSTILSNISIEVDASGLNVFNGDFQSSADSDVTGYNFHTINKEVGLLVLGHESEVSAEKFYEITLRTELSINSTQALNFRIPYVALGNYLVHLGGNVNTSTQYLDDSERTYIMSGEDLLSSFLVSVKLYVFHPDGLDSQFSGSVSIDVLSLKEVAANSVDSFENGYEQGFNDGVDVGFQTGFSDGHEQGFDEGFEAGVGSVDVQSYFEQGYVAGFDAAFVEGYNDGYYDGYADALEGFSFEDGQGLVLGEKQNFSFNVSLNPTLYFNTSYPSHIYTYDGYLFEDNGDLDVSFHPCTYGYHLATSVQLFSTSRDVYAYRVVLKPRSVVLDSFQIRTIRPVVGSYSDLVSLTGDIQFGSLVKNGGVGYSNFWFVSDYSVVPMYLGFLSYYFDDKSGDAFYDLNYAFDVEVIPYTKNEYDASVSAIEKQTLEIKKQTFEMEEQTEELKEQTETQKGMLSKMSEFFGGFFDNLKNAVIGLFVPSQEEMGSLFDRLMQFFNDTFGFLFYPFDFIVRLVELFLTSTNDNTSVVFPGFSIMGMQVWETMEFDLAEYEVTRELFGYVRMVTGAIIAFGFIDYLRKYFDKRFGGGGN